MWDGWPLQHEHWDVSAWIEWKNRKSRRAMDKLTDDDQGNGVRTLPEK
jgi:hypothetical protein